MEFHNTNFMLTVSGIGHKIKSVNNPDLRVELVKNYVMEHFPSHSLLDYALAVERVTTTKKDTVSIDSCPDSLFSARIPPWLLCVELMWLIHGVLF